MNQEQIIAEFVKCHSRLWAMAHAITRDFHITEDTLQEVSLVLMKKADTYDDSRPFVAWALGITRFQAMKQLDKRAKNTSYIDHQTLDILEDTIQEKPVELQEDRLQALKGCLRKISHENYQIMQMKYVEKFSARQIASKINRSETGTHSLYNGCV